MHWVLWVVCCFKRVLRWQQDDELLFLLWVLIWQWLTVTLISPKIFLNSIVFAGECLRRKACWGHWENGTLLCSYCIEVDTTRLNAACQPPSISVKWAVYADYPSISLICGLDSMMSVLKWELNLEAGSSESFVNLAACRAEDDNQRKTFGFAPSARVQELRKRILAFMETHIYPSEKELSALAFSDKKWTIHPIEEQLKKMAKSEGLWNLWIPVLLSLFTSSCPCN